MTQGEARITLDDTLLSAVAKLAEGNPGALHVLVAVLRDSPAIDPDCASPLMVLLDFDRLGLRGSRVWMLFKYVCGERLDRMLALLRARQLGFTTDAAILHAVENRGDGIDLDGLCDRVKARLPNFVLAAKETP